MRIDTEIKYDFSDVLIRPKRSTLSSRSQVELNRTYTFKHSGLNWTGVPIISANMDHTGTFGVATKMAEQGGLTALSKFQSLEDWQRVYKDSPETIASCFVSAGTNKDDFGQVQKVLAVVNTQFICLDVANGYSETFVDFVKQMRENFPDKTIMAGNVVTGEMVEQLILSGADIVKVGIGPGSVCTTRKKTGVGYPQLSAVIECADAAHGLGGLVCSDGGCVVPGDVSKAFAAGADFVMMGGMLAGHDECEGTVIEKEGKQYKRFYGMSSAEAMVRHRGGVANYRASEGKEVDVPYRGPIEQTLQDILGGVRSTCTYVGARTLKQLSRCTTFIRVNRQLNESFSAHEV